MLADIALSLQSPGRATLFRPGSSLCARPARRYVGLWSFGVGPSNSEPEGFGFSGLFRVVSIRRFGLVMELSLFMYVCMYVGM